MGSPVQALRDAGFSDEEVEAWAAEKRTALTDGGFKDNEIDAYFAGGVTVPEGVPVPFAQRFVGDAAGLDDVQKAAGPNLAGRLYGALTEGASAGFGEHPLAMSDEDVKKLQNIGIFNKPDQWDTMTGVRFANEAMIRPAYSAIAALFRGINAGIYGAGALGGQIIGEVTGADEGEMARARRDGAQFAVVATLLAGSNPVARTVRGPAGAPVTETIGTLPKAEDFANAARTIGGEDVTMAVQEKMLQAWTERGVHPAEMAADAARDPVLRQKLLSADPADAPYLKAEEGGKPPPKEPPAEPPAPPPEGSYEAAQQKVLERLSIGETTKNDWNLRRVYTELVDDLHPIKEVSDEAYQLARLTRGQFGKAEQFLERGTFDFHTLENTGKPLKEILDPVAKDMDGFRAYLAARRALEIEAREIKTGIDLAAARQVVDGGAKYAEAAKELTAYQNRLLGYLKDSGVLSEDGYAAMVEANRNYVPFYRVMTPERVPGSKGLGPGNPVHKLKGSEREIVDPVESVIKNTYAYISIAERNPAGLALIEALQKEGLKVTTERAAKADPELAEYLREHGVSKPDALTDFIKAGMPEDGTTLSAWKDGKKISVKVDDPLLVDAFRGLDRQSAGLLTRIFSVPARTMRAGAVLTPDFMARNLIRDFLTAFINTGRGVFTPIDTIKGLKSALTKDAHFEDWVKGGGANSTMVALDRAYLQESLSKLSGETGLMQRGWNVVTSPIRGLRMLSELAEQATRVGEFRRLARGAEGKADLQAAAFGSREITLDFARMGAKMRSYNMLTAFANAQIQGVDRIGRAFKDQPVQTTAKIAAGVTLPSVLLWWANHDDPRYQELPHWQKDLFWIIPTDRWEAASEGDAMKRPEHLRRKLGGQWQVNNGAIWRIPKPFEVGVVFGSGPERILEATVGQNEEAFDGFTKSIVEVLTPNFIPTAVQPMVEQFANRSTFVDRTLIPAYLEKQLPEYQYTPYTTQLARTLGQIVVEFPGMREAGAKPGELLGPASRALTSPVLIEHYVRSWTGGLGVYAMNAADYTLRKAGVLPDPVPPTPTLADIPFVKAFVARYPSAGMQVVQDFYDEHSRNKRFYDTWKAKADEGDEAAAQRIARAGGVQMFFRADAFQRTLGQHNKLIRDIYKDPDMPADQKRQLIDGLYYAMVQIARHGKDMMKDAKALQP